MLEANKKNKLKTKHKVKFFLITSVSPKVSDSLSFSSIQDSTSI